MVSGSTSVHPQALVETVPYLQFFGTGTGAGRLPVKDPDEEDETAVHPDVEDIDDFEEF